MSWWMLGLALAGKVEVFDVVIDLPLRPEAGRDPTHPFKRRWMFGAPPGRPAVSTETDDGRLRVSCERERKAFWITVQSEHYPTRLPEEITCNAGNTRILLRIRQVDPLYATSDESAFHLDGVTELRRRYTSILYQQGYSLPSEIQWTDATVAAEGPSDAWLQCSVKGGVHPMLTLAETSTGAPDGTGTCTLPLADGSTRDIQVRLSTHDGGLAPPFPPVRTIERE